MSENEVVCAVPGCTNTLTEEQRESKMVVCSSCEAAKMHICEACGRQISSKRIKDGATLCRNCEMNPSDMGDITAKNYGYESGYEPESEEEDFLI